MEGPYLNPDFGCDRTNNPWADGIFKEKYQPVIDAAGDLARVWCVAPEREGILDFILDCKAKNPNVFFAVAHSAASPQEIEALIPYGLRIGTHHTNATGDRPKYPECRGVCVDEAVWYNDDIYAEIISDKVGIHVDPYMQRLVRKIKGDDKVILISDAGVYDAPPPQGYEEATDIIFDHTGEISGTMMALSGACRNIMFHTGASITQAFKFASTNPAKMLSLTDRGEVGIGKLANLIVTDALFDVKHVFLKGNQIK
jgi:N-acetylglucosamine-6-phosphate deacetylase